jgi:glyoxylase-like metal-dependent hydrolase (beta-lactamase superfamily II)
MWPSPANIFVIPDKRGFSMIDVGCGGVSTADNLLKGLDHWGLNLKDLHTVLLSHAHPDHMGAMGWILREIQPQVFIHQLDVAPALDPKELIKTFDIALAIQSWGTSEKAIGDFDLLEFFKASHCSMSAAEEVEGIEEGHLFHLGDLSFEVIHTPGHSPGHISLFEKNEGILLPGDLVGEHTAWHTPTSGGVTAYLASLDKLQSLDAEMMLPAHGMKMEAPHEAIGSIREKLLKREAILLGALSDGPKSFMELNKTLHHHPNLYFFPGCGITESHLMKLEEEKAITREGEWIYPLSQKKSLGP